MFFLHYVNKPFIYLNRRYLTDSRELSEIDIKRASEFLGEILFEISGRTIRDYNSWAKSCLNSDIHTDLIQKAKGGKSDEKN